MTNINPAAEAARENARQGNGQFGEQHHSAPDVQVTALSEKEQAIVSLSHILDEHPDLRAHATDFIRRTAGDMWKPDLVYVHYDDELSDRNLDAYLTGDNDALDELDTLCREGENYDDAVDRYAEDLLGVELSELDDYDTELEIRDWIREMDRSDPVPQMVKNNGEALMQLPAADDDAFGLALQEASVMEDEDERYEAIEKVFHGVVENAGIELTEKNKSAIRDIISNLGLDSEYQSSEQWRLRLVTCSAPEDVAMSAYGKRSSTPRKVTLQNPNLLLVDPWNGRSFDVQLEGRYTTAVSEDRPARLDSVLGYGSLDKIAGVHRPYYRTEMTVEETTA